MDHTTLLGLLLAADPSQAACSFRTVFAEGETGETGTLRYLATDRWILDVDQGGRTVSTPHGSRCTGPDGNVRTDLPTTPSFTSAVALLVPRHRGIEGGQGHDWTLDFSVPVTETADGSLRAVLRHTERRDYQAEVTVHPTLHSILMMRTPAWTAELLDLRTVLSEPELKEMEQVLDEI
ncbi:hypothetical protein [Streptomyces sp. Isolate_45]|uniref:hypothetical protein n=1 Tax=Streptomyces sp. Isolate_45 TaxID=2950111 RepID=UPI002481CD26|nr:hypothetical protein [Streptomyces sp. Isolate_45]MDA5282765.1 hypothetical protein [Streptomyces sp. Isolate_45]